MSFWGVGLTCFLLVTTIFLLIYVCLVTTSTHSERLSYSKNTQKMLEEQTILITEIEKNKNANSALDTNSLQDNLRVSDQAPIYITSYVNPTDAGGSTVQRIISAYAVCKRLQKLRPELCFQFIHTENPILEKNIGLMSDEEWSNSWNGLLRFPLIQRETNMKKYRVIQPASMDDFLDILQHNPEHRFYNITNGKSLTDQDITVLEDVQDEIRHFYYTNLQLAPMSYDKDDGSVHVALHVRIVAAGDGDLNPIRKYFGQGNEDDDNYFFNHMRQIQEKLSSLPITFHIYSEGSFEALNKKTAFLLFQTEKNRVQFHLDENPFQSLRDMVQAHILVAANSSYSYLAHILRTGPTIRHKESQHEWPADAVYELSDAHYAQMI